MRSSVFKSSIGAFLAASLIISPTIASAAVSNGPVAQQMSPWVAFSAMSGSATAATMCGSSAAIAGGVATAGTPGCVLPQVDVPPPVAAAGPPSPIPVPPVEAPSAFFIDPLLLGLAAVALGALVYFLVIKKKNHNNSPA